MEKTKPSSRFLGLGVFGLLFLLWSSMGMAQNDVTRNSLQKIDAAAIGDQITVRMSFREPLKALPTGFALNNPSRVALDFPLVENAVSGQDLSAARGFLRNVRVAQTDARMRVVLNLDRVATFQSQLDGKDLLVTLVATEGTAAELKPVPAIAQLSQSSSPKKTVSVRDVSFRRGPSGEGRIVVDLEDPGVGIDVRKQAGNLVIEFSGASVSDSLLRKLDVTDFGTPVTSVSTLRGTDRVRIQVTPKTGNWDHISYQTDNQFVLEVKPQSDESMKAAGSSGGYAGERMSLRFREYPVREVLQAFSDFSNFNMVISDSVQGTITLNLQDVPWDQAMDIILQQKNLTMEKRGNVIMISPREEVMARAKVKNESIALEPSVDAIFQLNYLTADKAKAKVEEYLSFDPNSKKGVSLMAESGANKMFIKAPESAIEQIRRVIKEIDIPPRQVLIEARIVEASESFSRQLGVRFSGKATGTSSSGSATGTVANNINLPSSGLNLSFLLANASETRVLNLELGALESDGKGKTVSSPRVLATNGQSAKINDGKQIPYKATSITNGQANSSVTFVDATLGLDVKPTINADGKVDLELAVTKSSTGELTADGYVILKKDVKTKVVVDNGGTVVIGGIYLESESDAVDKIPLLGDIPFIGGLFRSKTVAKYRAEMLIFITPRIVGDQLTLQ